MFQRRVVEKFKKHILCSVIFFFFENRALYDIMWEKYCGAGQATRSAVLGYTYIACLVGI